MTAYDQAQKRVEDAPTPGEHSAPLQAKASGDAQNAAFRAHQQAILRKVAAGARGPQGSDGAGRPLPGTVQAKMEGAFGEDFSGVRVHEGPQASSIGAQAYAQGDNLHFAPGKFDAESPQGQELIGHELAHVVQQRAGRVATPQGKGGTINNDASLEAEADALGAQAARGEQVQVTGSSAGLQRKADGPIQRNTDGESDTERTGDIVQISALGDDQLEVKISPNDDTFELEAGMRCRILALPHVKVVITSVKSSYFYATVTGCTEGELLEQPNDVVISKQKEKASEAIANAYLVAPVRICGVSYTKGMLCFSPALEDHPDLNLSNATLYFDGAELNGVKPDSKRGQGYFRCDIPDDSELSTGQVLYIVVSGASSAHPYNEGTLFNDLETGLKAAQSLSAGGTVDFEDEEASEDSQEEPQTQDELEDDVSDQTADDDDGVETRDRDEAIGNADQDEDEDQDSDSSGTENTKEDEQDADMDALLEAGWEELEAILTDPRNVAAAYTGLLSVYLFGKDETNNLTGALQGLVTQSVAAELMDKLLDDPGVKFSLVAQSIAEDIGGQDAAWFAYRLGEHKNDSYVPPKSVFSNKYPGLQNAYSDGGFEPQRDFGKSDYKEFK